MIELLAYSHSNGAWPRRVLLIMNEYANLTSLCKHLMDFYHMPSQNQYGQRVFTKPHKYSPSYSRCWALDVCIRHLSRVHGFGTWEGGRPVPPSYCIHVDGSWVPGSASTKGDTQSHAQINATGAWVSGCVIWEGGAPVVRSYTWCWTFSAWRVPVDGSMARVAECCSWRAFPSA